MSRLVRRTVVATLAATLLSTTAAAHGVAAATTGLSFPLVVVGVVVVSLLGGGVLVVYGRLPRSIGRTALPSLVVALGAAALALAITRAPAVTLAGFTAGVAAVYLSGDAAVTDCGTCADAALGAVTLHRGLEGVVLATVYTADAALGLLGATVLAIHAVAETAAVGSLYAPDRRNALAAVLVVQVGFVAGVAAGWGAVLGVSPAVEAGLLAFVGGVLLAVGARQGYHRYAGQRSVSAA